MDFAADFDESQVPLFSHQALAFTKLLVVAMRLSRSIDKKDLILIMISNQRLSVSLIARLLGMKRQTIQWIVDRFILNGFVDAEKFCKTSKSKTYFLTWKGREYLRNKGAEYERFVVKKSFDVDRAAWRNAISTLETMNLN